MNSVIMSSKVIKHFWLKNLYSCILYGCKIVIILSESITKVVHSL